MTGFCGHTATSCTDLYHCSCVNTPNGQDENAGILSLCWQYHLHASIKIKKKIKMFSPDVKNSQLHQERFSMMGTELYLEACRPVEVVPVTHFTQNLANPYLNLNHHGLGPSIFCVPLFTFVSSQSNAAVTHLELEDKCILAEGAIMHSRDAMREFLPSRTGTQPDVVCSQNYCSLSSII
uniref:Uncharacterized protein n=1 Tax=Falco tinnunculus TaxID=100819 RepID=A0A8C4UYD1_FALTI